MKMHPGYIVPPIPKRGDKNLEQPYLQKKKHFLQLFIDNILSHPILRTSSLVFYFLSITLEKEYDSKKKACVKLPKIKEAKDARTMKSTARVGYDQFLQQYCDALGIGVDQLSPLYKK